MGCSVRWTTKQPTPPLICGMIDTPKLSVKAGEGHYFQWRGNVCSNSYWFADLNAALSISGLTLNTASTP